MSPPPLLDSRTFILFLLRAPILSSYGRFWKGPTDTFDRLVDLPLSLIHKLKSLSTPLHIILVDLKSFGNFIFPLDVFVLNISRRLFETVQVFITHE